jgi:hypothetical protein
MIAICPQIAEVSPPTPFHALIGRRSNKFETSLKQA